MHYEVAVVGLGVVGSSILSALAKSYNIVGIDQFEPLHTKGSSHGDSRLIRAAPSPGHPTYAELVGRSFQLFEEWSQKTGKTFVHMTGGFDASPRGYPWAEKARAVCDQYHIAYQEMSGKDFSQRYSNYSLPDDALVILQQRFGYVDADLTWKTQVDEAKAGGATLILNRKVREIEYSNPIKVVFDDGTGLTADKVFLTAGSWLGLLLKLDIPLSIGRRILTWYEIERAYADLLCFSYEGPLDVGDWYGMPVQNGKYLKLGEHRHLGEVADPDHVPPPNAKDEELLNGFITRYMRGIKPKPVKMVTCKYTVTQDENFIIDKHPLNPNVFIFSCCSGHGFKYAPVYGDIAQSMVEGKPYAINLDLFKLR